MMYLMKADHTGHCFKCENEYSEGEPVGVFVANSGHVITHYAHPQCWLELGLASIGEHPESVPDRQLTTEQRADRRAVLHHWAQLVYREKQMRAAYEGKKLEKMLERLEHNKRELRTKMMMLGGVPRSWER